MEFLTLDIEGHSKQYDMFKNNLSILICHYGIHSNEQHQQHNFEAEAAKTFFTDLMIQKGRWIMTSQG